MTSRGASPAMAAITSPGRNPARSAGDPDATATICGPAIAQGYRQAASGKATEQDCQT